MKRIYGILAIVLLTLFLVSGCGSGGSSAAKSIIKKQADVTEEYVNGLANAKNADDVVNTIDNFTKGMKELVPEILEFEKKYPEYKEGKVPEGLEADAKKMEEVSQKMGEAMMKMGQYMMNPKVQEAMNRMGEEMSRIDK
jgi:hypothetical protein